MHQFITNNRASCHLWLKENLLNHQKVSKYYEHDCLLENFILLFMSLLTVLIVKSSHILAGIYFVFLSTALNGFQYQIWISVKRSGK